MATVTIEQGVRNLDYVRRVIELKEPGSSAALKLAADLAGRELAGPSLMPRHISAGKGREGKRDETAPSWLPCRRPCGASTG